MADELGPSVRYRALVQVPTRQKKVADLESDLYTNRNATRGLTKNLSNDRDSGSHHHIEE